MDINQRNKHWLKTALIGVLYFITAVSAQAHSSSQSGILRTYYDSHAITTYIGGEDVGWGIDESAHTNGAYVYYTFDNDVTSTYKTMARAAAEKWADYFSIIESNSSAIGTIKLVYRTDVSWVARFCNYSANSAGHLLSWEIQLNTAKSISSTTIAHEFGHVLGLNDLYSISNQNRLMYGYENRTVTSPTLKDNWGARVITGEHTTHVWGEYQFAGGGKHTRICQSCGGYKVYEYCTYNALGFCVLCGEDG